MILSRKFLSLVAGLAAVAVLGACSSSGGGSKESISPAGASGSNSATGTPLKVGVICSCSGPFGTTVNAGGQVADAWAKSVNAAGGINGHSVELTKYDDAGNPSTSVTKVQSLISAHVDVILDLSPLDSAWTKAVDDAKIPVVGGELNSAVYFQDANFYPSGQTNDAVVASLVQSAKQAGAHKIGVLYCSEAPSCQELVDPTKKAAQAAGVPVTYTASIAATAPNYTAQCVAAQQQHVDALTVAHSASVLANVAKDCDRQGFHPVFLEAGTGFTMQLASTPGTKDNLWVSFPVLPFFSDAAPVQQMNQAVDKYYPGLRNDSSKWSEFAVQAWTGGILIEKAVAAAGSGDLSAEAITNGLNSLKNETLDGWSPPLTFTAGQPHSVHCWFTGRLQGGTPSLVGNGKQTCMGS